MPWNRSKPRFLTWERIMAAARFTVTKATDEEEQPITDSSGGYGSVPASGSVQVLRSGRDYAVVFGDNSLAHKDNLPLADNEDSLYGNHMALYEDDLSNAGKISQILNRITSYQAGMAPNVSDVEKEKQKPRSKAMLGTVL
ncbi:uncharacterized protein LOC101862038, partial [Aplysia californica]|uniref:Uncharacterized protein LOC101862038 n=1 Tax=Aplysia californica TaxID=6500 RepID=A0ABM1VU87_APLCA